jgi:hypothetical protein
MVLIGGVGSTQVGRGDLVGLRTGMKQHAGHVRDLRTLQAHFLAALPGISLPSIAKVCSFFFLIALEPSVQ